jgi:signal transduction histidine kinase
MISFFLLLPYALSRWGSGPEVLAGVGLLLLTAALGLVADWTSAGDAVFGMLFLLFPVVLGGFVRTWTTTRARELEQVKLQEREQLARELHDTVAHHVSAIAVRAQAGRVVAAERPGAAVDALEVIEAEASRALDEMRLVVGSLRRADEPDLAPPRGLADLTSLAPAGGGALHVEVELSGDLDDLPPPVGAAVYRLAQESVTNAARHARHATRITVRVSGGHDAVRLSVVDDGDPAASGHVNPSGYGLVGMAERAALVGGTLEAGPRPGGGWTVDAVLPRTGTAR